MKRTILLPSILLLILLLPVTVTAVGNITVSSTPHGAAIYLDEIYKATTPATIESVEAGTHTIVLTKSGYVNYTFSSFSVSNNQTTPLSATLTSTISAPTLSAISPSYGNNSSVYIAGLTGSGFTSGATIVLTGSGLTNITATNITFVSSTSMTCTLDLKGQPVGYRNVILANPDGQSVTMSSGFEIRNPTTGTISFGSSPSGASIYLNASKIGTTPFSLYDQVPGSYFIRMQRADYNDYTSQFVVTPGNTTQVYAYLTPVTTYTNTPTPTPIPTFTTVQTTKKTTTVKVPTPWPSATPTPTAPVSPLVILTAIGFGLVLLRKE